MRLSQTNDNGCAPMKSKEDKSCNKRGLPTNRRSIAMIVPNGYRYNRYRHACRPILDDDGRYPVRQTATICALHGFFDTTDYAWCGSPSSSILKHSVARATHHQSGVGNEGTKSQQNYTRTTADQEDEEKSPRTELIQLLHLLSYERYLKLYFISTLFF